jgi:galactokinase/mevalonate kinase-like predicted kinase
MQYKHDIDQYIYIYINSAQSKIQVSGFDKINRVNSYLKKNSIVLVKKQKQKSTGYNRVFDQVLWGQPGHWITLSGRPGHTRS